MVAESHAIEAVAVAQAEQFDTPPVVRRCVWPTLSQELRQKVDAGDVRLQVDAVVETNGKIVTIVAIRCPVPDLEPYIRAVLPEWNFIPATKGGRAVRCLITLPIRVTKDR